MVLAADLRGPARRRIEASDVGVDRGVEHDPHPMVRRRVGARIDETVVGVVGAPCPPADHAPAAGHPVGSQNKPFHSRGIRWITSLIQGKLVSS